jgi:hypothetical protein
MAARWRRGLFFVYLLDLVPVYLQVHDGSVVVELGEPVLRVGERAQRVPPSGTVSMLSFWPLTLAPRATTIAANGAASARRRVLLRFFRLLVLRGMF